MNNKWFKGIVILVGAIGVGCWIYYGQLEVKYLYYTHTPQIETGRVVPFEVKGNIVYVSKDENTLHMALGYAAVFFIALHFLGAYLWKRQSSKNEAKAA